ncbi:unnamed protein product [Clavelina lepadiformis]|uniref:Thyroglobulin type-1 domain-containing protein n=1 Tax=Clavelina lepadiformis TaxID=159417 RepID=A0ABP0FPA3_CLALP
MKQVIIVTLLTIVGTSLSLPIFAVNDVEVKQTGEYMLRVTFRSMDTADLYIIAVTETHPGEYDQGMQAHIITPNDLRDIDDKEITILMDVNLLPRTSYDVTVRGQKISDTTELVEVGVSRGSFVSKGCDTGLYCESATLGSAQCFLAEWRCDGKMDCADGMDEHLCHSENNETITDENQRSKVPDCVKKLQAVSLWLQENPSADFTDIQVPNCDQDGFYSAMQCHENKGFIYTCYCVDINGAPLGEPVNNANPFQFEDHCRTLRGEEIGNIGTDEDFY